MSSSSSLVVPLVVHDPRFAAGRALIQQGSLEPDDDGTTTTAGDGRRMAAIELFSTLLEECLAKYGNVGGNKDEEENGMTTLRSIETAPAFYEYGNALLRAAIASSSSSVALSGDIDDDDKSRTTSGSVHKERSKAAAAAEARAAAAGHGEDRQDEDQKPPATVISSHSSVSPPLTGKDMNGENDENKDGGDDDLLLALEMMENAYSILEDYSTMATTTTATSTIHTTTLPYLEWVNDQLPRVLLGIGDCLSALQRHADAADAYSRAHERRQKQLDDVILAKNENIEHLQCQRRVCEATVLIAEELLACPEGHDVVTTETQCVVVQAHERIEYARGYYDKARDSLQDTVYLMGKLASQRIDLGTEKEDVCFLATMIMGVGETLAALDEQQQQEESQKAATLSTEPVKKKARK